MINPDYSRGYNRGKASVNGQLAEYRKAVDEANERARRAEAGIVGPCQKCARWTRGSPGHPFWGYCDFPSSVGIADSNWWGEPGHKVCTQENFGCVRFMKRETVTRSSGCVFCDIGLVPDESGNHSAEGRLVVCALQQTPGA